MTTEPVSKPEGWGVIRPGNRIAHYYRGSDDCAACRKALAREAKARNAAK